MEENKSLPIFPFPAGTGDDHPVSQLNPDECSAIFGAIDITQPRRVEDSKVIESWNHHELRARQVIPLKCAEIEKLAEEASKLRASEGYKETMSRIMAKSENNLGFIGDCVSLYDETRKQVLKIHRFIKTHYKNHLSESSPDYLSLVSTELRQNVEPSDLLQKTISACDEAVALDAAEKTIAGFVTRVMKSVAPNLSAFVEPTVAAKLVAKAGGIEALAKMDACQIFCLGSNDGKAIGFLRKSIVYGVAGDVAGIELARGASSAAIADFGGCDPTGEAGRLGKVEMLKKLLPKSKSLLLRKKKVRKERLESELMSRILAKQLGPKVAAGKFKRTNRSASMS